MIDRAEPTADEMRVTLRELEFLNRRFGGHRYTRRFIAKRFLSGGRYRVLDIATGGGDFPRAMVDWARRNCVMLEIDAIDSNPTIIDLAREFAAGYPEIHFRVGRAQDFESDYYYDLVHCSLTLHHFSAAEAVEVLSRCRELSREHVLILDLERSFWSRIGVHLGNVLCRHSAMTVSDGDTSARRAFSFKEMRALAKGAGWPSFGHERFLFCRQALWAPA